MRQNMPYCKGLWTLRKAGQVLDSLLIEGQWQPKECHCESPCHHTIYQYRGDTTESREDEMARVKVGCYKWVVTNRVVVQFSGIWCGICGKVGRFRGIGLHEVVVTRWVFETRVFMFLRRMYIVSICPLGTKTWLLLTSLHLIWRHIQILDLPQVFFLDLVYEEVKEEFSYPFSSLVADIGGMAGLLLGASSELWARGCVGGGRREMYWLAKAV